jgi:hypothetical protein
MLNYLYSIFRRINTDKNQKFNPFWFYRMIFAFFAGIVALGIFLITNSDKLNSSLIVVILCLLFAFILVYPFIYALTSGYTYLEKVKEYTDLKAWIIGVFIIFLPVLLLFIFSKKM